MDFLLLDFDRYPNQNQRAPLPIPPPKKNPDEHIRRQNQAEIRNWDTNRDQTGCKGCSSVVSLGTGSLVGFGFCLWRNFDSSVCSSRKIR